MMRDFCGTKGTTRKMKQKWNLFGWRIYVITSAISLIKIGWCCFFPWKPLHINSILICRDLKALCRAFPTHSLRLVDRDPKVPPFCWVSTNRTGLSPQKIGYWSRWDCSAEWFNHTHTLLQAIMIKQVHMYESAKYADNGSVTWVRVTPNSKRMRQRKSPKSDRHSRDKSKSLVVNFFCPLQNGCVCIYIYVCVRPSSHGKKQEDLLSKVDHWLRMNW